MQLQKLDKMEDNPKAVFVGGVPVVITFINRDYNTSYCQKQAHKKPAFYLYSFPTVHACHNCLSNCTIHDNVHLWCRSHIFSRRIQTGKSKSFLLLSLQCCKLDNNMKNVYLRDC